MTKCGFVSVIGAPNVGKSTLINSLVGSKVTIVSPKVQTTRNCILGVALSDQTQIILVDTPGIFFNPKRHIEKSMVRTAWDSLKDADGIMVLMDASQSRQHDAETILSYLEEQGKRIILVFNKIDLIPKETLLALAKTYSKPFVDQIFMISALKGDGVQDLKSYWVQALPEGPWLFPEDQLSDLPERLLAAEITREEIFHRLHDELPYAVWVETQTWEDFKDGSVKISQTIFVQRDSQKPIVLGKEGRQIKAIGKAARTQMIDVFERPVHLFLQVKVKEKWIEDPRLYASIGLKF